MAFQLKEFLRTEQAPSAATSCRRSRSGPPTIGYKDGLDGNEDRDSNTWLTPRSQQWLLHLWRTWELVEHDIICAHLLGRQKDLKLKTFHIHAVCYLSLLSVACLCGAYLLQGVLIPVVLAAGLAIVLEPLVFLVVDPWVRCFTPIKRRPSFHGVVDCSTGTVGINLGTRGTLRDPEDGWLMWLSNLFRRVWCIVVVSCAIGGVLAIFVTVGMWCVASFQEVDWKKYIEGERLSFVRRELEARGIDDIGKAIEDSGLVVLQAIGIQAVGTTMQFLSNFLMTVLFLGFFLIDSATERSLGKEPWRYSQRKIMSQVMQHVASDGATESVLTLYDDAVPLAASLMGRVRIKMRAYVMAKFYFNVLRGIVIGTVFAILAVDLWVLWTILTFLLNFVPMGSVIAVLAPLPFVALDPKKELWEMFVVCGWPLFVNSVIGNLLEPKVFANSLRLHPVTVLMSLTFWTTIWGIVGALVCVPLTAMAIVFLEQMEAHPYSLPVLGILEGRPVPIGSTMADKEK